MTKIMTGSLENLISSNSSIFFKELKEVIKPQFSGLENPEKYKDILVNTIEQSKRPSLLKQAQVVSAATEYLENKNNKSLIISAEMGSGKSDMATKISLSKKLLPIWFIVCPPHLVDTWKEELALNYKNPHDYKVVRIKRWEDLVPYAKRDLRKDGVKYYFIITREGLKLSYPKDVAVSIKHKIIQQEDVIDNSVYLINKKIKVATCPDCGAELKEGVEHNVDLKTIPRKCENCSAILRQPSNDCSQRLRTREAIVDYIFKQFRSPFNLIIDEVHEYKGGDTGQGNAMGRIASKASKVVALTGTLMNGYASSIFYLLYRLNPTLMKNRLGYEYNEVKRFVADYGAHEEVYEAKDISVEGIVTRMGRRQRVKERPKISPFLLSVLLDMTIFLKLEEIKMPNNLQLPPYEEVIDLVEMEKELKKPYLSYLADITSRLRTNKALLGNLATDAIAIPDMPFLPRNAQNVCHYVPPSTREEFGLTNKEKKLIENIRIELDQGRDCLVYITFSNQQVATDLQEILSKAFPSKTIKFLPSTVPAAKRKEWIKNNPSDVLICNPELVKTGLTLLNFVTIIFYETTYNVFTLKQASRRSWRIGQKNDIKVIFMAYKDTPQHKALELIGSKIASANSLEGKLSGEDDLSSIGDDDDNIQLALAKAILEGDKASKEIKMTSIKNFGADREYNSFELYYQKLLDEHMPKIENVDKAKEEQTVSKTLVKKQITQESMFLEFAKQILEHHHSGDLYGGIRSSFKGYKGKTEYSTSYKCSYTLFEINDEYKQGKIDGIQVTYSRDNKNFVTKVDLNKVFYDKNIPYQRKGLFTSYDQSQIKKFIQDSNNDVYALSKLFMNAIKKESPKATADNFDEVGFMAIIGKGKKAKRVKYNPANTVDYNKSESIQLAFAF